MIVLAFWFVWFVLLVVLMTSYRSYFVVPVFMLESLLAFTTPLCSYPNITLVRYALSWMMAIANRQRSTRLF